MLKFLRERMIKWVRLFYTCRKSYVVNILTDEIALQSGIFQGCPISPFLFLFAMGVTVLGMRPNENIYGIFVENYELKLPLPAVDTKCFLVKHQQHFDSSNELFFFFNFFLLISNGGNDMMSYKEIDTYTFA